MDYKNLMGFLIIKELNQRQVRWAEMLFKYHFKIKHINRKDNKRIDILNRRAKIGRAHV